MNILEFGTPRGSSEINGFSHHKLIQRGISYFEREYNNRLHPEIRNARDTLYSLLSTHDPSTDDYRDIYAAEAILWASVSPGGETQKRNDGKLKPWHGYAVAIRRLKRGGDIQTAVIGLLHDTVEDSENVITTKILSDIFGEHTAQTVHLLSKVRSRKNPLRNHEETMMQLLKCIEHDPRGLVVKLDDRSNYWETSSSMSFVSRQDKAKETLIYYVPPANALGYHQDANSLAEAAFTELNIPVPDILLKSQNSYRRVLNKFSILCTGNTAKGKPVAEGIDAENHRGLIGWIDVDASVPRMPNRYDVFKILNTVKFDRKLMEIMKKARPPVIVPIVVDAASFAPDHVGPDEWETKVHGIAQWLVEKEYIPQSALTTIEQEMRRDKRSIRIHFMNYDTVRGEQVPIQVLFIRHEDHVRRSATFYDQSSDDPVLRQAAKDKIRSLQSAFKDLYYIGEQTVISDMLYCLRMGTKVVIVNNELVGRSADATVLDAIFGAATLGELDQIAKGVSIKSFPNGRSMALDEVVNEETKLQVIYGRKGIKIHPDWLTKCHMPSTIRFIQENLERRLGISLLWLNPTTQKDVRKLRIKIHDYLSLRDELLHEGLRVLQNAFYTYVDEMGGHAEEMQVPFIDLIELYGVDPKTMLYKDVQYAKKYGNKRIAQQCANFLYCLALRKPGYTLDAERTNSVWAVARQMAIRQLGLVIVMIPTVDKPGELARITRILAKNDINIRDISQKPDYVNDPSQAIISLALSPADAITARSIDSEYNLGIIEVDR